jgi:hypothetical protein
MVAYIYNPNIQEAKAGRSQGQGQPGLYCKFQTRLGYIVRPCLKKTKTKQNNPPSRKQSNKKESRTVKKVKSSKIWTY